MSRLAQTWLRASVYLNDLTKAGRSRPKHVRDTISKFIVSKHYCALGWLFDPLKPTSYVMHQQFNINNCTLCPHCIYLFCIYLRTNNDLCHLQHKLISSCNPHEKFLQRGTDWVFKYSSLSFLFKRLKCDGYFKYAQVQRYKILHSAHRVYLHKLIHPLDSWGSTATRLRARQSGVRIPVGTRDFSLLQKRPDRFSGPHIHLFNRFRGSFLEVKRSRREVNR